MKISNNKHIPFDKFIDIALYHKKTAYYIKKNPFGKDRDFITMSKIEQKYLEYIN